MARTFPRLRTLIPLLFALAGCVAQDPNPSPSDAAVDSSLRAAARASQQVHNYSGAVAHYASLYERNPEDQEVVLGYARNLRYLGDVSRAVVVLEAALATRPDDMVLLAEYGRALLAADRPADALVSLARVAEADGADWRARSAIGIAHDLLDQPDLAIAAYQDALAIEPNNPVVLNNLALSQTMAGDIEAGIASLRRALLSSASGVQERQNLAVLLALSGRLDEAEQLIQADLPREMARQNIAYLRALAASSAEGATPPEVLEELPVLTSLPKLEPIPATTEVVVEPVPPAEPEPEAAEAAEAAETNNGTGEDFAAAAADAAEAAFASLGGGTDAAAVDLFGAQLASYTSEQDATEGRASLVGALGDLGSSLRVVAVERGAEPKLYRVYAGPFTPINDAQAVCLDVREAGLDCVVTPAP